MNFTDTLTLDGAIRRTADGYGVVSARVARGGNVQVYLGSELGITDKSIVRVYRPETEVFKKDAIASYAGVPITVGHPKQSVSAETWKDLAVGEVGDDVLRDGEFVRVPMMLRDAKAIAAVEGGTRELSMGYSADVKMLDGVTPKGEAFDAIMSDFKMNHVAIVDQARGGTELRIGDGAWGASPFEDQSGLAPITMEKDVMSELLKTVVLGDKAVQVAIADVAAIDAFKAETAKTIADADKAHQTAIAAKDADHAKAMAAKDAEIEGLKAKVVSDADIDKRVQAKAELVAVARAIAKDVKVEGLSDAAIRKAVVVAKLGDEVIKDKSDVYIDARFDILVDEAKKATPDPFASAVKDGLTNAVNDDDASKAYATMLADMKTAHLPKSA
jgi:hypothetical protein